MKKRLTGQQLVEIGATKHSASLPETGLKNVTSKGSWLEKKQIEAALDAQKQLLSIEKIEKRGALSIAEWNEELGLAEVKQKIGGHWQFLGHANNLKTYLKPEEALYLMEVNCLQLTYNEVTVSIQQAYTILLRGEVKLLQYKVYASLSRVGYKLFRHECSQTESKDCDENKEEDICEQNEGKGDSLDVESNSLISHETTDARNENITQNIQDQIIPECIDEKGDRKTDVNITSNILIKKGTDNDNTAQIDSEQSSNTEADNLNSLLAKKPTKSLLRKELKLKQLRERKYLPLSSETVSRCFENIPELAQAKCVNINAPNELFLPRNVFPNCTSYNVDVNKITDKNTSEKVGGRTYSFSDEVNGSHIRRIRGAAREMPRQANFPNRPFRNQNYNDLYCKRHGNFNVFGNRHFHPRFSHPRQDQPSFYFRPRHDHPRGTQSSSYSKFKKHRKATKYDHLTQIFSKVAKFQNLVRLGARNPKDIWDILNFLKAYNNQYNARLRLTQTLDLVDDNDAVTEVIELDDDSPPSKKAKTNDQTDHKENLTAIKILAQKLKEMKSKGEKLARQRRALSNVIKLFNKTYNRDLYIDDEYDVLDRNEIVLDSSDSDCVIDEPVKSKKLRNMFNVLRRRSFDISSTDKAQASTSTDTQLNNAKTYKENILKTFNTWLPPEDDFGRAEVLTAADSLNLLQNIQREMFLYEYLKEFNYNYENWCQVKASFWESLEEQPDISVAETESNETEDTTLSTDSFTNFETMLDKIRVINNNKEILRECDLKIDFDAYNRDVPNFKKSSRPPPHFRIICLDENNPVPSAAEIATLSARYSDNVPIVYAIVGNGTGSISYLQMNPCDLPIYIPNSDIM